MQRRNKTVLIIPMLLLAPAGVQAGFIKLWQLKETAAAPMLVVGRILSVQKGERVPDGSLPWNAETLAMTAEIQVLRSYPVSQERVLPDRLHFHFLAYGPSVTSSVNGYPPPLPNFEPGKVLILPLQENKSPDSDLWQLMAESGMNLTIPARTEIAEAEPPPATAARAFLDREIANSLSRGTPAEVSAVAAYIENQHDDLTGALMQLLAPAIGDDRERWAEVATNLLAAQGTPRPSTADLLAGKTKPKDWPGRPSLLLAQAALQKLKASAETNALLIATWIAEAPLHARGSANSLLEYGDNPITTEALREALRNDLHGTSYIAWTLARNGYQATLPEALARALKVADRPDANGTDLQGAAALLRDHGSDQQLAQLASLVRKYQTLDRNFYQMLWQSATESDNPREARVLAVVLRDRRVISNQTGSNQTRYCDFAVGVLERAVGQDFRTGLHTGDQTLEERDQAVTRALAWLASQGLSTPSPSN
jgi:DnaJ-domain-containing protein 1